VSRSDLYPLGRVSRLYGLPESRLREWGTRGLLAPSLDSPDGRQYTFQDLVGLRTLVRLLEAGVPPRRIERRLTSLKALLPEVRYPLAELRIEVIGRSRVLVSHRSFLLEPGGQMVLRFEEGRDARAPEQSSPRPSQPRD
jgi:DNA-binding transcriptional MerR regulator